MKTAWVLLALLALGSVPTVQAQEPSTAPPVVFEDIAIDGLVVPLEETEEATGSVAIGCDAAETIRTTTEAHIRPAGGPEGVNVIVSPISLAWQSGPGDCPSPEGTPYEDTYQVSVALTQNVPAFEPVSVPLEMTVTKAPPGPAAEENRSYGPYVAHLNFTPGYFNLYNTRLDEKVASVNVDEAARFEGTIDNFSNDATRFDLEPIEVPESATADVEPPTMTLEPEETGTFTIVVEWTDPSSTVTRETVSPRFEITSASASHPDHEGARSEVSVLARFEGTGTETTGVPGPGATLALVAALGGALVQAGRRSTR